MQNDIKTNNRAGLIAPRTQNTPTNSGRWYQRDNGIMGVLLALAVLSIAYSSYIVWFGTQSTVDKVMLVPQILLAAKIFVAKFVK